MVIFGLHCKKSNQEPWLILLSNILWKPVDLPPAPIVAKTQGISDHLWIENVILHIIFREDNLR